MTTATAQTPPTHTSGYAAINGLNMYSEIHGSGFMPLVLIHGGGSTIESTFGTLLPLLAKDNKVIAVELQAHGRTSDREGPESFEQDADDVAALLRHLGVEKANILGFSNGGTTTLQIAIRHVQLVNKIVVISANYTRDGMMPGFFEGMQQATLHNMPQPLQDAYLKVNPDKQGLQTMFEKDRDRMIHFKDIPDEYLQAIKVPSLLMVGDKDVMSVAHVLKMSQLIPDAQLIVMPGAHGAFIGEVCSAVQGSKAPATAAALIQEFLND